MAKGRMRSRTRAGVAVGLAGLLLGTASAQGGSAVAAWTVPGPELEYEWETGTAGTVHDGDTLSVSIATSNSGYTGTQRVRTIGINAPEVAINGTPAQCGAAQAKGALTSLAPNGTVLQLRALAGTSYDADRSRLVRSIYALDDEGNWFDTARQLVSDGNVLWFPHPPTLADNPEWAHNLEYRVLAEDARVAARGLWSPDLCGPSPAANLRVSVSWDQSVDGHEKVFVVNDAPEPVSLGGWTLRDSALNLYRFPGYAVVAGRSSIEVRLAAGSDDPAGGVYYAGAQVWFDNLPADNPQFAGDAAFLMDNAGPYQTGNMRAWAPYPCNPDECGDPLVGAVTISGTPDWNTGQDVPGTPRQLNAVAQAGGDIAVAWQEPTYTGGSITDYRLTATLSGGAALPTRTVTGTSYTFTDLSVGQAYTFHVVARNPQGSSAATAESTPVTAHEPPDAPTGANGTPGDRQIVARWTAPGDDNGAPIVSYTATATPSASGAPGSCVTGGAQTSCVIPGLTNGASYRVAVTASNAAGESATSTSSQPLAPAPYTPGASPATAPRDVTALPTDGAAVVAWLPPTADGGSEITEYTAEVVADAARRCVVAGVPGTPALSPATSCVIAGLTNGTSYVFTVRATANTLGPITDPSIGPSSPASAPVTPTPDGRAGSATGIPGPDTGVWVPRETFPISNTTSSAIDLTGYALWDKDPRITTDTPDHVFPRGTVVPANGTLRVRSGPPTTLEPASAILHYTGRATLFTEAGDRIELANLNKAPVACTSWGGVTCRGQQPVSTSTQPVGVTARTTASSMTVAWGAPISRGGTAITGYTATAFDAPNGGNVVGACSTGGTERACTISGLVLGGRYYAEVGATNAVGTSAPSAPRVLGAPRTVPSAPGNVTATGVPGGMSVTWTPAAENGATIIRYTASAYTAGTGGSPVASCRTSNGTMTGCAIPNLQQGTPYFIDVTATNRAGTGAANSPRVVAMPSGAPRAISTYSKGKVTVRWDRPADGSAVITGYSAKLYTKASAGRRVGSCTAAAGKTSCTTKKMKKRSKYYISLSTITTAGTFTVTPRMVTGPARKASAPKVTGATPAGNRVVIAWNPPTFNGYSYLKGYGARLYSKYKGGKVKATCSAKASATTCTTKAMKKGNYYSAVRVKNSKGWSTWSKRVKVVIR